MGEPLPEDRIERLYAAFLSLRSPEECRSFFEDLATPQEIETFASRLEVAKMLYQEKRTFAEITEATGVSSATIARVRRCIHYGGGGYRLVLDRLDDGGTVQGE